MYDAPRETLIVALEKIGKGSMPDDQHNLLRAFHHGYVETTAFITKNARGQTCVRRYGVKLTYAGRELIDAVYE